MKSVNLKKRLEELYTKVFSLAKQVPETISPYLRRFVRFLALPYCFIFLINWEECKKAKYLVAKDLIYIYFVLKYYPYNYSLCRLWEKNRDTWKYYYGSNYEPYQKARLSKEVQKKEYSIIFDDKEVCYQLCKALNVPLPEQFGALDPKENYKQKLIDMINQYPEKKLIIKPVRGSGGKDILLAHKNNDKIVIQKKDEISLLENFTLEYRSVVQGYLEQHPKLSIYSKSLNTIRVVTLLSRGNEVSIVGAFMRFGIGESYVDNLSSGGIAVGVDICNGKLKDLAYDFNSKVYKYLPTTNCVFSGFAIPFWQEVVDLAKMIQSSFSYYRLLGLDIGVTPNGPVLIEINPSHDNIALEQSYGPILINNNIRDEFRKYGLLVNNLLQN